MVRVFVFLALMSLAFCNTSFAKPYNLDIFEDKDGSLKTTVITCGNDVSFVGLVGTKTKHKDSLKLGIDSDCVQTTIPMNNDLKQTYAIFVVKGVYTFEKIDLSSKSILSRFFKQYAYVFVFIGGFISAFLGKILSFFSDPLILSVKVHMYYKQTVKYYEAVADVFERDDFVINETLVELSNGRIVSSYLIGPVKLEDVIALVSNINSWKTRAMNDNDFKKFLKTLRK